MKKSIVYFKFTNAAETHNGFKFRTGLNTDTNPFDLDQDDEYGLHFTNVKQCANWLGLDSAYVREVTLPKGERKVILGNDYRAHRIILGTRHDLSTVAAWKWLVNKGLEVTAHNNYAVRWASATGKLAIVKHLVSKGAIVTALNNEAIRLSSTLGHLDVVKYLVSKGADATANDNESFHRAIANGHLDVAKYLVSTGAVFPDSRM